MRPEELRRRLVDEMARVAGESLSKPTSKDAYGYGRACGFYAGLQHAIAVIDNVHHDEEEKDKTL